MNDAPTNIDACRRALEARQHEKRATNRQLWERARADAELIIAQLAATYHPKRIWQWGSVLDADRFNEGSDIDLAIEGDFTPESWFRLLGDAMVMTRFSVDIVDLGHIEPEFAEIIKMKGRVVYERNEHTD